MAQIFKFPADKALFRAFPLYREEKERRYFFQLEWINKQQSEIKDFFNPQENMAIKFINQITQGFAGQVFFLHDYDIIGIIKAIPVKEIDAFYQSLLQAFGISEQDLKLHLVDLGMHYDRAEIIIENKEYKFSKFNKPTAVKSKKIETPKVSINFSEDLITSISERRERQNKSVLLVEDDAFSRQLVKNVIGKEYRIIEAESAADAISAYVMNAPDIVFLDINLPDGTGINIIDKIKEFDKEAFIVMLSGNAYAANITHALDKGAKGFIGKPFNKKRLLDALQLSPHIREKELQFH